MSTSTRDFYERIESLNCVLQERYKRACRRKKTFLKSTALHNTSWGAEDENALYELQEALCNAVKLAYPKDDQVICTFTYASVLFWASVITQIPKDQFGKKMEDLKHEPMAFLDGHFVGAKRNWTTYENGSYAIVGTFDRMNYLRWGPQPVHVHTDDCNLLFVFATLSIRPNLPQHALSKVHL